MKKHLILIISLVFLYGLLPAQENKASVQLASAIYEEEVTGNLDRAIELYQDILKKYPDDRPVSAKALYHLGVVSEKMGRQKASEYFTRLVNSYPDQTEMVAMAKIKLNRLLASPEVHKKPIFRKINIPTRLTPSVKLSPDGKNLAFVIEKKLWTMPLSGNLGNEFPGTPVQVNTEGIMVEWSGLSWSGDGKLIAFNDLPKNKDPEKEYFQSIYIVNSSGGDPKEVINNYRDVRVVNYRMSLSPDGKKLAYTSVENNKQFIYAKNVAGGVQKRLVEKQAREPVYSPDGKWIAYVEDKSLGSEGGNLWIIPESGGIAELVAEAGHATSPVWSPDGKTIAYLDKEKKKEINFVQLKGDSQITNKITSIEAPRETEEIFLISGWTTDNRLGLLLVTKRQFSIYTLPSNGGPATMLSSDGYMAHPRWSPDGKQIFYTVEINQGNGQNIRGWLASVPAGGGSGQTLPDDKSGDTLRLWPYFGGNRVSPDGKMIISSAYTSKDTSSFNPNFPRFKIWKIAVDGTESKQITNRQGPYADLFPCWSPDGRRVAFLRVQVSNSGAEDYDKADICIADASGGEPEILFSTSSHRIISLVWSPDGKMIAYFSKEREAPHTSYMNTINVENNETRIIGEIPSIYVSNEPAWSPDNKRIAFNYNEVIKVMNVESGNIEDIKTNLENVKTYHFDWSPDGERFVFTGWKGGDLEFWFLEDFLPIERPEAMEGTARSSARKATNDLTHTKIYKGNACAVSISPDGKRLALIRTELSSNDIWIRDVETGKENLLTSLIKPGWEAEWSPDNQWIAFADQDRDIKVVPSDGGSLRTLFKADENTWNTAGIMPTGWTSDSRKVMFHVPSKGLFAVSVAGGAPEPVCIFENPDEARNHEAMALSPNGRWIAYSAIQDGNTDIFVKSISKKDPIRITTGPADDRRPRWSRDGNWIAYTSSGIENPQIWAVRITSGGEPAGQPVQISKDAYVLGGDWMGGAGFGFNAAYRIEHIFTANADGTGEIQLTHFPSFNSSPRWSPNGDRIAFRSDYRKPLNRFHLWTVPSGGGTPKSVTDKEVSDFLWSRDGEKLLFKTGAGSNRSVYLEIPAGGGESREIMTLPDDTDGLNRSPDGRSIAFTFTVKPARFATADEYMKERLSGIGIIPNGSGEPRILISADKKGIWYSDCRLDPEGKRIAYIMFDYAKYGKEGMYSIWTMDVNGGTPRQIAGGGEYSLCWSPDGKWIVFEKRIKDMDFELYKVPANGGEPVKMNIRGRSPEFSPDGKKIAYSRRVDSGYESWQVENFLPKK